MQKSFTNSCSTYVMRIDVFTYFRRFYVLLFPGTGVLGESPANSVDQRFKEYTTHPLYRYLIQNKT